MADGKPAEREEEEKAEEAVNAAEGEATREATVAATMAAADAVEEEEEEQATAEAEQAALASLLDTVAYIDGQTCAACTVVCGEKFDTATMTLKARGFHNQWVCADRAACLVRMQSGTGGERARKAPRRE